MVPDRSLTAIRKIPSELKKPVRVIVFTTDRGCPSCPDMVDLGREIKKHFSKVALEIYDVVMDRDKSQQYGIKLTPSLVIQGGEGQAVTFSGNIDDVALDMLLDTIKSLGDAKIWFPENIVHALQHLTHDVSVRVFLESDCARCRPVAETAIGMALTSTFIYADIIVASEFPDLVKKYGITSLPKTIFGENLHLDGHVPEGQFIEMVFQAEGVKPGPDRRCIMCGNTSPDIICTHCKARVEAEAREHKLKSEKTKH